MQAVKFIGLSLALTGIIHMAQVLVMNTKVSSMIVVAGGVGAAAYWWASKEGV